ncbi:Retrotransposable element Tf2 protein [Rhizoctonia solani]|uniref:Retrotransposable element Tf2 protein n=1 Tax=Rhizoctonia solani TaxID=456999 RepID=A0A8H8P3I7_9AGAM|nr:Retrotransposable element Tf2 protein [Rhizoctonia solani]QRW23271.1 Retrotransposable element Tf2 protein [Rhizoctonia solani]
MKSSAKEWVECCPICQSNQQTRAPVIALKPLEVPPYPFHSISYNFITGFPKSQGYDAILVVIDSFSKFGHFIPTLKKVSAKGLADLFITHVWKLHGLPIKTVSDHGTTFTGKFLRALYQRLGIKPSFSSAYHPESDGQTERVNQFIEFYLRSYVTANHSDWSSWLPLAEYAYNNAKHAATGKTPFELVYGRNPVMNPSNVPSNVPEADQVADTLAKEWKEAESALRMIWLDGKNVELRTNSNKLDPKRLGPFEVTEKISSHAYHLKLLETLKIHNVFYVGLLSKAHESPSQPFPERPPPETIEGEEEYELAYNTNYDTHNKELLAIIKALEEWQIFLEATDKPIQVFTDHWNLEYWMQARTFNRRHARWRVFLSNFNFEIHYCPGKQLGKLDALSRRSDYTDVPPESEVMLPTEVFANTSKEELEIVTDIRAKLKEDPSLEPIIQFLTEDANNAPPSIQKAYQDYDWEEELLWYRGKLVVPDSEPLKERLLREFHDSPLAGHPGQQRTLELLSRNYWWPGMKSSAKEWVECCPTCQANRCAHAPVISLKPLDVPPFPFHTISYNFITGFPSQKDMMQSWVTAKGLANLFVTHIWKLHGLPVRTISDQGTTFTRKFLRALYQRLGINPSFSLAYHPESDRQTKRVNQFIEFYLRSYIAADHLDWARWLPLAEYTYNNAKHSATGKTPFKLVYGRNPVMNPSMVPANVPEADTVADTLAQEWKEAKSALRMSKERMSRNLGTVPEYSVGKEVWLDGKNVELRTNSNKLDPKQLGPFKVIEKISSHAYHLELPKTLKIHDIFYVGLLSKSHKSPSQPFPERPPPETIEGEEEYKVEQIIDSKQLRGKWFYLIKWKGYGLEDNSWEPEELLDHSQEEIKQFNQARLRKACDTAKSL